MFFPPNRWTLLAALLVGGLLSNPQAFDGLSLSIEKLEAAGWRAEGLDFSLQGLSGDGTAYRLNIGQLELMELRQLVKDIDIDCLAGEISDSQISCRQGRVRIPIAQLDRPELELSFSFEPRTGRLSGKLQGVALAGGRLDLEFELERESWRAQITGRRLALDSLVQVLPEQYRPLPGWSYAGQLKPRISLVGRGAQLLNADWAIDFSSLNFADAEAASMAEGLGGKVSGRLTASAGGWRLKGRLDADHGELLTPYFYLSPVGHPLSLATSLSIDAGLQRIEVGASSLQLGELLGLVFQGGFDLASDRPLQRLQLEMPPAGTALIYQELLQPVLLGTSWERLELEGEIGLKAKVDGENSSLELTLNELSFDDAETADNPRRFGLYGLNGKVNWSQDAEPGESHIAWLNGHLLERIDLGPGGIDFNLQGRDFRLLREARIPILDGELKIDRLRMQSLATPDQAFQFDAILTPISMASLSEALGWMPLKGKLSGVIPGLSYKNGEFALDGVLLVSIFDGDVLIERLKVRDLFGVYPQLSANIEIKGLDLETLTGAFSFGRITGRLDGTIRDLSLEQWRPVAFDAHFHTPKDDNSRHRISQKAVDNISNLGGAGMSGALARSFLGFFEEFGYKRLGLGCRLKSGQCEMRGVGEAKQGYYLVEGSGIPRIDIIGYNRTADWERLVEQLKQITESSAPVIQ